jgi:hypothetical protein
MIHHWYEACELVPNAMHRDLENGMTSARPSRLVDWKRNDEIFFIAGACHILAHVFVEVYPRSGFRPFIIAPVSGERGYHVFVARDDVAFDARGYRARHRLIAEHIERQRGRDALWDFRITALDVPVVTAEFCARYRHLSFDEYPTNPEPRALVYLSRFPAP